MSPGKSFIPDIYYLFTKITALLIQLVGIVSCISESLNVK